MIKLSKATTRKFKSSMMMNKNKNLNQLKVKDLKKKSNQKSIKV